MIHCKASFPERSVIIFFKILQNYEKKNKFMRAHLYYDSPGMSFSREKVEFKSFRSISQRKDPLQKCSISVNHFEPLKTAERMDLKWKKRISNIKYQLKLSLTI